MVHVTPEALADLEDIAQFLEPISADLADATLDRLARSFDTLSGMPRIGRPRQDLAKRPVRVWVVRPFVIIYRDVGDEVHVLRVLHGARDTRGLIAPEPRRKTKPR